MRDSSTVPQTGPRGASAHRPLRGDPSTIGTSNAVLAVAIGFGTTVWQHMALAPTSGASGHLPYLVIDAMLAVPVAALAIWLVTAVRRRLSPGHHPEPGTDARRALTGAVAVGLAYAALCVPLAMVQHLAHLVLGPAGHDHGAGAPATAGVAGLIGYGVVQALQSQAAILVLALGAAAAVRTRPRRIWRRVVRPMLRPAGRMGLTITVVAGSLAGAVVAASPANAGGSCSGATTRTFNVVAIDVDIVVNRFGDHDPYGYMYVLADREDEVRAQEAALRAASSLPVTDPNAAKVSIGLAQDPIQPLVLRARLGECVVINLHEQAAECPTLGPQRQPRARPARWDPVGVHRHGGRVVRRGRRPGRPAGRCQLARHGGGAGRDQAVPVLPRPDDGRGGQGLPQRRQLVPTDLARTLRRARRRAVGRPVVRPRHRRGEDQRHQLEQLGGHGQAEQRPDLPRVHDHLPRDRRRELQPAPAPAGERRGRPRRRSGAVRPPATDDRHRGDQPDHTHRRWGWDERLPSGQPGAELPQRVVLPSAAAACGAGSRPRSDTRQRVARPTAPTRSATRRHRYRGPTWASRPRPGSCTPASNNCTCTTCTAAGPDGG